MEKSKRYYFVDEAGDLTLFNKKGKVIIGQEGCSNYFILGIAQINNPHETRVKINELRNVILSDAYLQSIPSVQRKTKYFFHTKDDCPEVRRDFYRLIASLDAKVYCIIRRKSQILKTVLNNNKYYNGWKYNQNKEYDSCVKRIFKDRLHSVEKNQITFARRGKSDRNKILTQELNNRFKKYGVYYDARNELTVEKNKRFFKRLGSIS